MFDRRDVLKGVAGLPLATVLADPILARAAAQTLDPVSITTDAGQTVNAVFGLPARTPAASILLIHEWWGLNDQIKAVAADFVKQGYAALAVDLMKGQVAETREEARTQTQAVQQAEALDTLTGWIDWLRAHEATTDKLGTVGWCFGGGWSLNASIAAPVDATVIYYGRVTQPASELKRLKGPVLGHFGTKDGFIDAEMVSGFEQEMAKAGKSDRLTVHWYEADHAFANPSGGRYDADDAALAWERTTAFFDTYLT